MKNLAGHEDADTHCIAELAIARIPFKRIDKRYGEPKTCIVGDLGGIYFTRAWYYWIANGKVPLFLAKWLYEQQIGREAVRVAGHCGCPPPAEPWVEWYDGDEIVVVDLDGKHRASYDRMLERGVMDPDEVPRIVITTDGLQGYVMSYHIDTQEGLDLFAQALRGEVGPGAEGQNR